MNRIVVKKDARDLGIVNPVGCRIRGLDVQIGAPELDEDVAEIEKTIKENPDAILDKPEVRGFRELFDRIGHPDQTPSGEQLVNLIGKKGLNRHNNVVDAYNVAGAESGVILGMHDVSHIDGDIVIQRASGGERFLPIFHKDYETAQPGDLLWGTDRHILALLGPVSRDSDKHKITESTEEALLMAPGNHETSEEYNREVCRRAYDLISKTNPDATLEFLDVVSEDKHKVAAP